MILKRYWLALGYASLTVLLLAAPYAQLMDERGAAIVNFGLQAMLSALLFVWGPQALVNLRRWIIRHFGPLSGWAKAFMVPYDEPQLRFSARFLSLLLLAMALSKLALRLRPAAP